jgi:hypothetical protein
VLLLAHVLASEILIPAQVILTALMQIHVAQHVKLPSQIAIKFQAAAPSALAVASATLATRKCVIQGKYVNAPCLEHAPMTVTLAIHGMALHVLQVGLHGVCAKKLLAAECTLKIALRMMKSW